MIKMTSFLSAAESLMRCRSRRWLLSSQRPDEAKTKKTSIFFSPVTGFSHTISDLMCAEEGSISSWEVSPLIKTNGTWLGLLLMALALKC